jgi:hypothetical protein
MAAAGLAMIMAASVHAQFGRGFFNARVATPQDFDGLFHYCRIVYRPSMNGSGGSWRTDFPRADQNLSIRLGELTKVSISKSAGGAPNTLLVRLGGDELFQCPLVIMSAPGDASIDTTEGRRLREYLLKGGFLWADDFWGTYQWEHWVSQLRNALPAAEYPIVDLPLTHALFKTQFLVEEIPQNPNIGFFIRSGGGTSELGADSAVPHVRGITDPAGRLIVVMTHNTDIADAWEREGDDPSYFYNFSPRGYAFGINTVLYALTH